MSTNEASLKALDSGLAPVTDGWFVVNAQDAAWQVHPRFGARCTFELGRRVLGEREDLEPAPFPQMGVNLDVFWPGQPSTLYHAETEQEDFLVLTGECVAILEDEERRLRAWDFVHCPPGTHHVFIGAGDGPCVILMLGARPQRGHRLSALGARAQVRRRRRDADGFAGRRLRPSRLLAAGPPRALGRASLGGWVTHGRRGEPARLRPPCARSAACPSRVRPVRAPDTRR
jgi:uncharacterized cupin superfamily protein